MGAIKRARSRGKSYCFNQRRCFNCAEMLPSQKLRQTADRHVHIVARSINRDILHERSLLDEEQERGVALLLMSLLAIPSAETAEVCRGTFESLICDPKRCNF